MKKKKLLVLIIALLLAGGISLIMKARSARDAALIEKSREEFKEIKKVVEKSSAVVKKKISGEEKVFSTLDGFETYSGLEAYIANYSLFGLSEETLKELMYALEFYYAGDEDTSYAMLEMLFATASPEEKPQLGIFLLERYLKYVGKNKAAEIAYTLNLEFPESPFSHLGQAFLDLRMGRSRLAFESLEKVFLSGEGDRRIYGWLNAMQQFYGTRAQEDEVEGWLLKQHELYPKNQAVMLSTSFFYQAHRKPKDAIAIFEEFEKVCTDNSLLANHMHSLAQSYWGIGERNKGLEVLERSKELDPENPWSYLVTGRYLRQMGKTKEALLNMEKAAEVAESAEMKGKIYREMVWMYRWTGNKKEMLEASKKAVLADPENPRNLLSLAQSYQRLGDIESATETSRLALAQEGTMAMSPWVLSQCYVNISELCERNKDYEGLLKGLEKAAEVQLTYNFDRGNWTFDNFLQSYSEHKGQEEAIAKAEEFLEKFPEKASVYRDIGDFYHEMKDYDKAEEFYGQAAELSQRDDETLEALIRQSAVYAEKNDYPKALKLADKIASDFPYRYETYVYMGHVYQQAGDGEKALEEFQTAYEMTDIAWEKSGVLRQIAGLYDKAGDKESAIINYEKIIEFYPTDWANAELARYYEKNENYDGALVLYQKAAELSEDPERKGDYYNDVARIQLQEGAQHDAVETMRGYVESYPEEPVVHSQFASLYQQAEDYRHAEEEYSKAIELAEQDVPAKLRYSEELANMYINNTQDYRKAEALAEKMIELDPESSRGYEVKGDILRAENVPDEALAQYQKALEVASPREAQEIEAKIEELQKVPEVSYE